MLFCMLVKGTADGTVKDYVPEVCPLRFFCRQLWRRYRDFTLATLLFGAWPSWLILCTQRCRCFTNISYPRNQRVFTEGLLWEWAGNFGCLVPSHSSSFLLGVDIVTHVYGKYITPFASHPSDPWFFRLLQNSVHQFQLDISILAYKLIATKSYWTQLIWIHHLGNERPLDSGSISERMSLTWWYQKRSTQPKPFMLQSTPFSIDFLWQRISRQNVKS